MVPGRWLLGRVGRLEKRNNGNRLKKHGRTLPLSTRRVFARLLGVIPPRELWGSSNITGWGAGKAGSREIECDQSWKEPHNAFMLAQIGGIASASAVSELSFSHIRPVVRDELRRMPEPSTPALTLAVNNDLIRADECTSVVEDREVG